MTVIRVAFHSFDLCFDFLCLPLFKNQEKKFYFTSSNSILHFTIHLDLIDHRCAPLRFALDLQLHLARLPILHEKLDQASVLRDEEAHLLLDALQPPLQQIGIAVEAANRNSALVASASDSTDGLAKVRRKELMGRRVLGRGREGDAVGESEGRSGRSGRDVDRSGS